MTVMGGMDSIESVKGIVIVDGDCKRLACKYYATDMKVFADFKSQQKFENQVMGKLTGKVNEIDIVFEDDFIILAKCLKGDVVVMMIADSDENELMLLDVMDGFCQALQAVAPGPDAKQAIFQQLEQVQLLIDEIVERGIILETDYSVLVNRINMQDDALPEAPTVGDALKQAKASIWESLLKK